MKNTFVKVLSFVMALMMVVGTFSTLAVFAADECTHANRTAGEPVAPTCTTFGYTPYKCNDCGEEFIADPVEPDKDAHELETIDGVEASCLTNSKAAGVKCKNCDYTTTDWDKDTQLKHKIVGDYIDATCSEYGYYTYKCETCGYSVKDILANKKINDDLTLSFRADQKAELESYQDKKNENDKPKNEGHPADKNFKWVVDEADDKCSSGWAWKVCVFCEEEIKDTKKELLPTHDYTLNLNPNGAACSPYVADLMVCPDCKKPAPNTPNNGLKSNSSEHAEWNGLAENPYYLVLTTGAASGVYDITATNMPKYVKEGFSFVYGDSNKNLVYPSDSTKIGKLTHSELANDYEGLAVGDKTYVDATHENPGHALVQCACGDIFYIVIPVKEHALVYSNVIYPTTCTEATIQKITCSLDLEDGSNCPYEEIVVLKEAAATEHNYSVDSSKAATCTEAGMVVKSCQNTFVNATGKQVCGEYGEANPAATKDEGNYVVTYEDAIGHEWGEYYYVSGTCGEDDFKVRRDCKNCLDPLKEGEKVGADAVAAVNIKNCAGDGKVITVAATCVEPAYTCTTCVYCGNPVNKTYVKDSVAVTTAHVYPTASDFVYTGLIVSDEDAIKAENRITFAVDSEYTYGDHNYNWLKGWNKLPTCVAGGEAIVSCKNCGNADTKLVATPKLDHVMGGAYVVVDTYTNAQSQDVEYQYAVKDVWDGDGYCELPEHVAHVDDCYDKTAATICGNEDVNHVHENACYVLTCQLAIHTHVEECDPDFETDSNKCVVLPATCQKVGYMDDGDICFMCLQGTQPTEIAKNPYNHEGVVVDEDTMTIGDGNETWANRATITNSTIVLQFVDATCGSDAYWVLNLTGDDTCGCGYTRQYVEGTKLVDEHNWVVMPYKAPTCYKAGNHAYVYCKDCGFRPDFSTHEWTAYGSNLTDIKGEAVTSCGCAEHYALIELEAEKITAELQAANKLNAEIIAVRAHKWNPVDAKHNCVHQDGKKAYKDCAYCNSVQYGNNVYDLDDTTAAGEFEKLTKIDALKADKGLKTEATPGVCDYYAITPVIYVQKWNAEKKAWENDTTKVLYNGTASKSTNYCEICDAGTKTHYNWIDGVKKESFSYNGWEDVLGYWTKDGNWLWSGENTAWDEIMVPDAAGSWYAVREYFLNGKLDGKTVVTDEDQLDALEKIFNDNYKKYENFTHDETKKTYIRVDEAGNLESCTENGYIITECKNCSGVYEVEEIPATNTTHAWEADSTATLVPMIDGKVVDSKLCEAEWYSVVGCASCNATNPTFHSAPIGHYADVYNAQTGKYDRVVFDLSCDKIADYKDMTCTGCGGAMKDLNKDNKLAAHKYTVLEEKATCEKAGFVIKTCSVCGDVVNTPVDMLSKDGKHAVPVDSDGKKVYLEYVAPTVTTDGYAKYICANKGCGLTVEETLTATDLFDTVTVTEYETYAAGNTIKANVTVTGSAFEFNTITIKVEKPDALKLVEVELDATFGGASVDVAIVNGNIQIFVLDSVEGDKLNATFEGGEDVALLTLTFTTNKMATGEKLTITTTATEYMFWNAEYDEDDKKETNPEQISGLEDAAEIEPATFAILTVGDVNGKNGIDASDIQAFLPALNAAALTGEYIAKYDLNNDGVVDFTDVAGLRAFVADSNSLYTYFEMIGEDVDAVLDAVVAPQIVSNAAVIAALIEKADAYQVALDAKEAAEKALTDYTGSDATEIAKLNKAIDDADDVIAALEEKGYDEAADDLKNKTTKVTYVEDASDRNTLFKAAMRAYFGAMNHEDYKALCAEKGVDNLTDLVAKIVKEATQAIYANPDAADFYNRSIVFTTDSIYVDGELFVEY